MKTIGFLLISTGFLAGALIAVVHEEQVNWLYFILAITVGFAGVLVVRLCQRQHIGGEDKLASNMSEITSTLQRIVDGVSRLNTGKNSIDTCDMRHQIDEQITGDIGAFAESRQTIAAACGLAAYADIMSHFAAGERYLNRVWSASADGYVDEVNTYLEKSLRQFTQALDLMKKQKQTPL